MDSAAHLQRIRQNLKSAALKGKHDFATRHPKADSLAGFPIGRIREHSLKLLSAGVIGGTLLMAPISGLKYLPKTAQQMEKLPEPLPPMSPWGSLKSLIEDKLGDAPTQIPRDIEKQLEQKVSETYNIPAKVSLEGERLNLVYGLIGAEQHLRRYPGDTLSQHGSLEDQKEGIAPGLGAWGYFAPSKEALDESLIETEKWYVVAQTLYLPDWGKRQPYLKNWYKYRKMIVINTLNGKAVVGAIADAGPAAWTGKHFGGSPEVMDHLGGARYKKGPVLFLFVDDPDNKIPLGPVEAEDYNN
jgi:hypothetical protein